jgi:hypothetical protein
MILYFTKNKRNILGGGGVINRYYEYNDIVLMKLNNNINGQLMFWMGVYCPLIFERPVINKHDEKDRNVSVLNVFLYLFFYFLNYDVH